MVTLSELRKGWQPQIPRQLLKPKELHFVQKSLPPNRAAEALFPFTSHQPLLKLERGDPQESNPLRVGVLFSGGPASGGHNVIAALFDTLKTLHEKSMLIGFLGGSKGLLEERYISLTEEILANFRNQGGFDLLGSGRLKLDKEEQFARAGQVVEKWGLDALVIIGGDDSNTNAAFLAEYFLRTKCKTAVIGVPKTIDGDLQTPYTAISFGFDTACKVYSELIGNIARDCLSTQKYYHFIKLMGRSASHITLECALSTQPNYALISEEVFAQKETLSDLVKKIADLICKRSQQGKEYGVLLIPEGLVESLADLSLLIEELNTLGEEALHKLSATSRSCFELLPLPIRTQLLLDRDPHGNVQLSLIETEKLLAEKVAEELKKRKEKGSFQGSFRTQTHFFGYEGRAAFPSCFDSNYCYALGITTALLAAYGASGYMSFISDLDKPVSAWQAGGVPLTSLIDLEKRKGSQQAVIKKTLVDLSSKAFNHFQQKRESWEMEDAYLFPGPMQFFAPEALNEICPAILRLN